VLQPAEDAPLERRFADWAQMIVAVGVVIALLRWAEAFFVPLFIGILTSYTLQPAAGALERVHIPRPLGAALVLAAALGLSGGIVASLWTDAAGLFDQLPVAARKLREGLSLRGASGSNPVASVKKAAEELDKAAAEAAGQRPKPPATPSPSSGLAEGAQQFVLQKTADAVALATKLVVAILIAYFLLSAGDFFRRKLARIAGPTLAKRRVTVEILQEIDQHVQRYMLILILTNVLVGLAVWGFFSWMDVERGALWGVIAAVFHTVPYAGIALVALAGAVAGLLQFGDIGMAATLAGGVLVIATAIGTVFNTWAQSRVSKMNAVVVFAGVLFFGWLWGGWGLLLGVPLLAVMKTISDRVPALTPVSELMGD
jgi:predicted PurR-regulated permease PerM